MCQKCVHCKKKKENVSLGFNEITGFGDREVEEAYCYGGIRVTEMGVHWIGLIQARDRWIPLTLKMKTLTLILLTWRIG